MSINQLSIEISKHEAKKKQVNIAQIKEIVKVLGIIFASLNVFNLIKLIYNLRQSGKK